MALTSGTRLGPYEILAPIGAGGMGEVYKARDTRLDRTVAIKVLPEHLAESPERKARFEREAKAISQLNHPHICTLYDVGVQDGIDFIVMEYIEGETLAERLKKGALPLDEALEYGIQMAEGLDKAHRAGIVHRDVKPGNVMVSRDGVVKLLDFGLARTEPQLRAEIDSESPTDLKTREGVIAGTLHYMSPEQAEGKPVDHLSDIFSLGVILYEMLAGRRPFEGDSAASLFSSLLRDSPPPMSGFGASVPKKLEHLVHRCLAKEPSGRVENALDLRNELEQLLKKPGTTALLRTGAAVAGALAVVIALTITVHLLLPSAPTTGPTAADAREPISILIADFDNLTGNALFDDSLEHALKIGIEGASFITAYPRSNALSQAKTLGLGEKLDAHVARLIAVRHDVKLVLAGSIESEGNGFRLRLRALDPQPGEVLTEVEARAGTSAEVLIALDTLVRAVRDELGDESLEVDRLLTGDSATSTSLEALKDFNTADRLARAGQDEEAITFYKSALAKDSNLAPAYSGWGLSAFKIGRLDESDEQWKKALSLLDRMTERERYRILGLYYTLVSLNYDKAIENYEYLVAKFPADGSSHNNLSVLYTFTAQYDKALAQSEQLLKIYPERTLYRGNHAQYAMYAGDVESAAQYAQTVIDTDPTFFKSYMVLALASLYDGEIGAAKDAYRRMADSGSRGASLAAIGLADIALFEGHIEEALTILEDAMAVDETENNDRGLQAKMVGMAQAYVAQDREDEALLLVDRLGESRGDGQLVPSAEIYTATGRYDEAGTIAGQYRAQFRPTARAYGKLIDGMISHHQGEHVAAVDSLREALDYADLWIVRFYLGQAYLAAGYPAEASQEFQSCIDRRSEASGLFFDDIPTWRYTASLSRWKEKANSQL